MLKQRVFDENRGTCIIQCCTNLVKTEGFSSKGVRLYSKKCTTHINEKLKFIKKCKGCGIDFETKTDRRVYCGDYQNTGCYVKKYQITRKDKLPQDLFRNKFNRYKINAKSRGLDFTISLEEFRELTSKKCEYCGDFKIPNGLDRVDNSIHYHFTNLVPCCSRCNYSKHTMSKDDFISMAKKIVNNLS